MSIFHTTSETNGSSPLVTIKSSKITMCNSGGRYSSFMASSACPCSPLRRFRTFSIFYHKSVFLSSPFAFFPFYAFVSFSPPVFSRLPPPLPEKIFRLFAPSCPPALFAFVSTLPYPFAIKTTFSPPRGSSAGKGGVRARRPV